MDTTHLLSDQSMQRFIRDGYVSFKVNLPPAFHKALYDNTEQMFASVGNPSNNLLPRLPEIQQVFTDPTFKGAMVSILGPDYYLHPHRHCHENHPNSGDQVMNMDSTFNSVPAIDDNHRHHHTRWAMAFYYPQDTPVEMGPTAVWPRSQYCNSQPPLEKRDEVALVGEAGTVAIVNFDIFHRQMCNHSEKTRYMMKFIFSRMSEPTHPSWNHQGANWQKSDDLQEPIWSYLWQWHLGKQNGEPEDILLETADELRDLLRSDQEIVGIQAAYKLGKLGPKGLEKLIEVITDNDPVSCRNAIYGLTQISELAVPALVNLLLHHSAKVRARAADTLYDLGLNARSSLPALIECLSDQNDQVRYHAANAIGTVTYDQDIDIEPLAKALKDKVDLVRRNAALSLARLGRRANQDESVLKEALADPDHLVRAFSVQALERIGTPKAMAVLLDHLRAARWCPRH